MREPPKSSKLQVRLIISVHIVIAVMPRKWHPVFTSWNFAHCLSRCFDVRILQCVHAESGPQQHWIWMDPDERPGIKSHHVAVIRSLSLVLAVVGVSLGTPMVLFLKHREFVGRCPVGLNLPPKMGCGHPPNRLHLSQQCLRGLAWDQG